MQLENECDHPIYWFASGEVHLDMSVGDMSIKHAISRKSYSHRSRTPATRIVMPNKWLAELGLLSLKQLWGELTTHLANNTEGTA